MPERVTAVVSLASPAPYGKPDLDYFTGMGQDNLDDMKLFLKDQEAARKKVAVDREALLQVTPDQIVSAWASLLSPVDQAAMSDEAASHLVASMQDGLAPGDHGWWDDSRAEMEPWGFSFADIRVPVQLWHGRRDRFVPFQHGQWLAERIPGVEAHLTETDGHVTLARGVPEVHAWLLEHH